MTGVESLVKRSAPDRSAIALIALGGCALAFVVLPLVGLVSRTPWRDFVDALQDPAVLDALRLSAITSTSAATLAAIVGVPLAWVLARTSFPGKGFVRALVLVPLVLPPVVSGVALLLAFGPRGLLGPALSAIGITLPFTTAGAIVAATFVALPFLVLSVEGAIAGLDRQHEDVAATLGASTVRIFTRITLPLVGPALLSGLVLAWARALGEFGATLIFAGNLQGVTQTMPLAVYQSLAVSPRSALALSIVLLMVSAAVIVLLHQRWLPGLTIRS